MAEITPVAPAVPAAPATLIATATPAAPTQDFLGQLTAALKTLKSLTGLAGIITSAPAPTRSGADTVADPSSPQDEVAPSEDSPASPPDDILELLATLGLVPVPTSQPVQASSPGTAADAEVAPAPLPLMQSPAAQQPVADVDAASSATTSPVVQTPQTPVNNNVPAAQPQPPAVQPAGMHSVVHTAVASTTSDPGLQQGTDRGGGDLRDHTSKASAVTGATTDDAPTVDHSAAIPIPPPTSAEPAPQGAQNVHPTEIVNQIAQQVDLYRLPGGRGVRIQLHPEDLGGVQVTLRYAAGGSLELHINVEHAATGALVQAGIGQLRDALATQGFQSDRLVLSVSAPSASSQMDFSSNGNGGAYRSDSGLTAFMQGGQSGQQRESADDAPRRLGWTSGSTAVQGVEAPTMASESTTSRIDYRV